MNVSLVASPLRQMHTNALNEANSSHSEPPATVAPGQPSTKKRKQCQNCSQDGAMYTCPRCSFQSCSLACTKAHRYRVSITPSGPQTIEVCSGVKENNAGGYVNINEYGYSSFVKDYVFLEDIGRKMNEWGRDIQTNLRGGANGGSNNTHRHHHPKTKRDLLKERLDELDIDMELLPQGMHRRKINQSTWDPSSQKAFFTIAYRFHQSASSKENVELLTHRNELHMKIGEGLRRAVNEKKKGILPDWIQQLIGVEDGSGGDDEMQKFKISMGVAVPRDLTRSKLKTTSKNEIIKQRYIDVDSKSTLEEVLKGTSFVEFPTFEITGLYDLHDSIQESDDSEEEEVPQRSKRMKLDEEAGKRLLGGLAAYGSDDEGSSNEEKDIATVQNTRGLSALQALDYESDSSSEEGSEGEQDRDVKETYEGVAAHTGFVDSFDEGDVVDWGD